MAVTVNIYYKGKGDNARLFAQKMTDCGIPDSDRKFIRTE